MDKQIGIVEQIKKLMDRYERQIIIDRKLERKMDSDIEIGKKLWINKLIERYTVKKKGR